MAAPSLLLITDRNNTALPLSDVLAQALQAGCRWIMIREKDLATAELCPVVEATVTVAKDFGATVSVNNDFTAASICKVKAVHLPQGQPVATIRRVMGPETLIGVSAHSVAEAQLAAAEGANYVTASPVFATDSKPGYGPALEPEGLAQIVASVRIPVLALGGVTAENAASCIAAGAAGVAVMGSVMRAQNPGAIVGELIAALAATQG
ncbi:MAG: thiamine phosphate synthase [Rhodospirillaceae bacterium]|nr:thiamine phosphate synthase [Rhodospirillaceae bacterium]MDD9915614.1 thiamine phosphate synthase [Rhodospirillaceae bacterium]MDD9926354.1 thiamine phosphate synthase [Rhodospirillaceae bacterium]